MGTSSSLTIKPISPMSTHTTHTHTHTPGPWKTLGDEYSGKTGNPWAVKRYVVTHDAEWDWDDPSSLITGKIICAMRDGDLGNPDLIAAAPDLLAALRSLVAQSEKAVAECLRHNPEGWDWGTLPVEMAKRAIARAEGREP